MNTSFQLLYVSFALTVLGNSHSAMALPKEQQDAIQLPVEGNVILSGKRVSFYEDDGKLSFEEILNRKFQRSEKETLNFGYTSKSVWIKIEINSQSPSSFWVIELENPNLKEIQFYASDSRQPMATETKFSNKHINWIFPIKNGTHTYYLRIKSDQSLLVPLRIAETEYLLESRHKMDVYQGIYYGMLFSIIVFNLFILFSLRDKTYLYYIAYTISIAFLTAHQTGYLRNIGGASMSWIDSYSILTTLTCIFIFLCISSFLELKRKFFFSTAEKIILAGLLFSIGLEISGYNLIANKMTAILALAAILNVIVSTSSSYFIRKYRPAGFLLLAWSVFLLSLIVYIATDFGIFPYSIITNSGPQFGNCLETVLISLALSDRVALIKKSTLISQQNERLLMLEYNKALTEQSSALQDAVRNRTEELKKANEIKDRFFSIVAHDLRNPLHSLASLLHLFQSEVSSKITREQFISLTNRLGASIRNTINLTENLLTWARSQMKKDKIIKEEIEFQTVIKQCLVEINNMAVVKNIQIKNDVKGNVTIKADLQHVLFIIRNLLSNAVKFTLPNGLVTLRAIQKNNFLEFSVQDTGIGMSTVVLEQIFDIDVRKSLPGTNGEKGTGLGLSLCKEFILQNGGLIRVESLLGKGSRFTVSFPLSIHSVIRTNKRLSFHVFNNSSRK